MKSKYSQKKFLVAFVAVIAVITGIQELFHFDTPPFPEAEPSQAVAMAETDIVDSLDQEEQLLNLSAEDAEEEFTEQIDPSSDSSDEASEQPNEEAVERSGKPKASDTIPPARTRRNIRRGTRLVSYHDCFPDVQDVQLPAAQRNGIYPMETRDEIHQLVAQRKLVDITTSPFYVVDQLSHSMPYLVPKAQHLLNTIAVNFLDSLSSKGLKPHLPVVSSVLRSTGDVKRLQRGNGNATTNSCHCYGTTIDIAYHRFMPVEPEYPTEGLELERWNDDLKFVLGEVLNDLRLQGKCYVKYEYKQACFHLTVR